MSDNIANSDLPVTNSSLQPGLQKAGDYIIHALTIVTSDGTAIDIRSHAVEINLYEDVFSPCMSGSLLMGDAQDLIYNFKLHGNEYLVVNIDKPGLKSPINKVFRIYKISEREYKSASMQNYIINFCSEEMIISTGSYVSKAYKGIAISDMIKDITTNKLGAGTKMNFWDTTDGLFSIVVPRMHPLEAIQWLATRSYSSNGTIFLYYETRDGYNFESYESMMARPPYKKYTYSVKLDSEPADTHYKLNYAKISKDFDIIQTGQYGGFSSTLMAYDIISREMVGNRVVAFDQDVLNDNIPINQSKNRFKQPLTGADYLIKLYPMTDSDSTSNPSQPYNWLHIKAQRLAQLYSFKMVATVQGDILLKAGCIVEVEVPTSQVKTNSGSGDGVNQMRSGKYLVTAIHHIFINDNAVTVMELVSDSVVGELVASNDGSTGMQKIKAS